MIAADGARDGFEFSIRRHLWDEVLAVETPELLFSDTAREGGDVVYVGVVHHGGERGFRVAGFEFVAAVLFPEVDEVLGGHGCLLLREIVYACGVWGCNGEGRPGGGC